MPEISPKKVTLPPSITLKRFSELLALPVSTVITELIKNGIFATINEKIDFETASIIAQDLGFEAIEEAVDAGSTMTLEDLLEICKKEVMEGENLKERPPVVTILGHVDHGKTTLLDTIRKTSVAMKESGGITQHISAYQVKKKGQLITFIDTPGHEAFSAMRERGVSLADIAVLVVAADDGVRPQTKEVIEYLLAKKIPVIVAINKIDKPGVNVQRVKQELAENGILLEEWGGQVLSSKVSAKENIGIDDLLDNILLISEVEAFKANNERNALGIILEAHLDPHKGPVSTVLVKTGILKEGQDVIAGNTFGRVRRLEDFTGKRIPEAKPGTPVSLIGLRATPNSNDILQVVASKSIGQSKLNESKNLSHGEASSNLNTEKIYSSLSNASINKLNVIIKADVHGSLEAIQQILSEIKSDSVAIDYVGTGIGNVTESDVRFAASSKSIIFGFNVEITPVAKRMAEASNVEVKNYKIIYELIDDIKARLLAMLPDEFERTDFGKMKVLAIFKTGKHDMIIGGKVISGRIENDSQLEVERKETIIGKGSMGNLQSNKVNVNDCKAPNECGITFIGDTKIKTDDILISYKESLKKKAL
ncbi:MAG: translation initiation factor IF-2 [Candidatus Moraniibacteriota bacterium]